MGNKDRYLDLSSKLIQMGQALAKEGNEKKDYNITQTGNNLIFLGSIIFNEKDIFLFSELTSMFSAKKILETMESENHDFIKLLKGMSINETYEDFIKRINKLREDNGHEPIE